jgi:hypothetical protein
MSRGEHNALVVLAGVAVVALGAAVASGVFAFARTHRQRARIDELEAKVRTLCTRQTVSRIAVAKSGRITSFTDKGC